MSRLGKSLIWYAFSLLLAVLSFDEQPHSSQGAVFVASFLLCVAHGTCELINWASWEIAQSAQQEEAASVLARGGDESVPEDWQF